MTKANCLVLFGALFVSGTWLRAEHPDFSGRWTLDVPVSTFSAGPEVSGGTLNIARRHHWIHVTESFTFPRGSRQKEFGWKIDDKFHPIDGPGTGEVLARWDHDVLTGDRRTGDGASVETVRMSERDPGALVETIHRPNGESVLVWRRRP